MKQEYIEYLEYCFVKCGSLNLHFHASFIDILTMHLSYGINFSLFFIKKKNCALITI